MRFATLRIISFFAFGLGAGSPALADLNAALASADPTAGERAFRRCASCHTVELGGRNMVGPNLYGIVGGSVAAIEGFRYSSALREYSGDWTPERLDAFLANPREEVGGTRMGFAGVRDAEDRADLIAFLNTQSDNPLNFGSSEAAAAPDDTNVGEEDFGVLVNAPGAETTYYACVACHSERIVAQQGLTRAGWDDLLEWMVEDQGMMEIEEPDRTEILDYLAAHYNTDRANFPPPIN